MSSSLKHIYTLLFLFFIVNAPCFAQLERYNTAFNELKAMLEGEQEKDIIRAVYVAENAWFSQNEMNFSDFESKIDEIAAACKQIIDKKGLQTFLTAKNWAIFMYMTQAIPENDFQAIEYNFDDFLGNHDFSNTFVISSLQNDKGTCLSMPLLYVCIAQKLKAEAKLTLGPNHAWIRHQDETGEWVNVELTSGQFPTDGGLMTFLDIKRAALQTNAYFKPLNDTEVIAFLLTQLAFGYEDRTGRLDDFTDKCADLSIRYFAPNISAYCIKINRIIAEATAKQEQDIAVGELHTQYLRYQVVLDSLGVNNVDEDDYNQWVKEMNAHKNKTP